MKRRESELERRLEEWAKEWGGGKHRQESSLKSWLESMIKWHGRPPSGLGYIPIDTPADDVQNAVIALANQKNGKVPAAVLRCEYFSGSPRMEKRRRLARFGMQMDDSRYSQHLRLAKVHVAAWLKVPFDELSESDIAQEISMLEYLVEQEA